MINDPETPTENSQSAKPTKELEQIVIMIDTDDHGPATIFANTVEVEGINGKEGGFRILFIQD